MNKINVLVVDDSSLMRLIISDIIKSDNQLKVIGSAKDGKEAVDRVKSLKPDIVLLDMTMEDYDGLYAVKRIMKECPVPIIILSALGNTNMAPILEALELGAVDYIIKPEGSVTSKVREVHQKIISKVKAAATSNIEHTKHLNLPSYTFDHTFDEDPRHDILVIGASTGGPAALHRVIGRLPGNLIIPVLIAQHIPENFVDSFVKRLNQITPLEVVVGKEDMRIEAGKIYVAPGDKNMIIKKTKTRTPKIALITTKFSEYNFPSVNALMISVAEVYKERTVATLLTGMGKDGAVALNRLRKSGAFTIAQDKESSVVFGMPGEAIRLGAATEILPLSSIAKKLIEQTKE